ncbi:MAG: TrpB-like pyridoxal phosphate-dependent enzyme [Desulfurococcales archaeon]|jgi:tryptophan synthase beta chain|nr:TrpB-like pyridoxal phosphate-dependent enzyme [Desulfurococcales archaeon]
MGIGGRPSIRASQIEEFVPKYWYNILPDLPKPLPPPRLPDGSVPPRSMFERLFPRSLVDQEISQERFIKIPEEIRETLISLGRPTPLIRARRLEQYLKTPARIYYKFEGVLPTGSHKVNTAVAQAYYNKIEGIERVSTETGAGQWGSALSLAGALFGLKVRVFMVRSSYEQKPYRRVLMELYGAEVIPSPSNITKFGRSVLEKDPNNPGSLGIAISEAIEDVLSDEKARYSLGSVLNHVLLHQTIIGLEAKKQLEEIGEREPDYVVGCVGGGSNFAGLSYPFIHDRLRGKSNTRFLAVEPKACPSLTRGVYTYDYGDTAGLTPLLKMYTVGHRYRVPPIHAGGLRYHGDAPTLCLLVAEKIIEAVAYHQTEIFEAGKIFARAEGIVPAPESAHAVKAVIDLALEARKKNEEMVILFNLSGHGLLDLQGYKEYLEGKLADYEPETIDLSYLPKIGEG